jgi:hypothetical protein
MTSTHFPLWWNTDLLPTKLCICETFTLVNPATHLKTSCMHARKVCKSLKLKLAHSLPSASCVQRFIPSQSVVKPTGPSEWTCKIEKFMLKISLITLVAMAQWKRVYISCILPEWFMEWIPLFVARRGSRRIKYKSKEMRRNNRAPTYI